MPIGRRKSAAVQESLRKIVHDQMPDEGLELRFCHRNGKLFDVLLLVSPIKDAHGQVAGWLGSVTDITKRRYAERRLQVQHDVARVLSLAADLKTASPQILSAVGESMGWEAGGLWRITPGTTELNCVGAWQAPSVTAAEFEAASPHRIGLPDRVLATGQPFWGPDFSLENDSSSTKDAGAEGLRGACAFPIRLGSEVLGVIGFYSRSIPEPDDTKRQWMAAIGNQIGQFMEREMAEEGLRRANDELEQRVQERTADLMGANLELESAMRERKRLENELLEITEKERRRIGLDLHDDLGQKLAGLTLMMKGLESALEKKKLPEADEARRSRP